MIKLLSFLLFCQLNSMVNTMNQENQNIIDNKIHIEIDDLNNQINHNNQIESNHEIVETQSAQTMDQLNQSIGYNFKQKVNTSIVALNTTINTIGNGFKILVGFVKNFFSSVNCFALKDKTDENPTVNFNDIEKINQEINQDQIQKKSSCHIKHFSIVDNNKQVNRLQHNRKISDKSKPNDFIDKSDFFEIYQLTNTQPFDFKVNEESYNFNQSKNQHNFYQTERKINIEELEHNSLTTPDLIYNNNNNKFKIIEEEKNQEKKDFSLDLSFLSENE